VPTKLWLKSIKELLEYYLQDRCLLQVPVTQDFTLNWTGKLVLRPLYEFLRESFNNWNQLNLSSKLLVEVWLTYLQPWLLHKHASQPLQNDFPQPW
jgi:hypothetical protein